MTVDKFSQQRDLAPRRPVHLLFVLYVLVMVLIFLVPVPSVPGLRPPGGFDKLVHLGIFLGFAVLYALDRHPMPGRTLLVSFAFAAAIELAQGLLPYRSADWRDFVAGAAGAGIGVVLTLLFTRRHGRAKDSDVNPG